MTSVEGGDLILNCISEGNPAPSFTWSRDGVTLSSTLYTNTPTDPMIGIVPPFTRTNGTTTSMLTISGAVYPEDDGVYECIGTNSHAGIDNSSSASITVTVQGTSPLTYNTEHVSLLFAHKFRRPVLCTPVVACLVHELYCLYVAMWLCVCAVCPAPCLNPSSTYLLTYRCP